MNISGKTALVVVDFQGGDLSGPQAAYENEHLKKAMAMVAECRTQACRWSGSRRCTRRT